MLLDINGCPSFTLLTTASPAAKWQTVCSYAIINHSQAVAAAMARHPVAAASAVQLAASCSNDLGPLVHQALQWTAQELPALLNVDDKAHGVGGPIDLSEYLWAPAEDDANATSRKAAPPASPRTTRPAPRPALRSSSSPSPISPTRVESPRAPTAAASVASTVSATAAAGASASPRGEFGTAAGASAGARGTGAVRVFDTAAGAGAGREGLMLMRSEAAPAAVRGCSESHSEEGLHSVERSQGDQVLADKHQQQQQEQQQQQQQQQQDQEHEQQQQQQQEQEQQQEQQRVHLAAPQVHAAVGDGGSGLQHCPAAPLQRRRSGGAADAAPRVTGPLGREGSAEASGCPEPDPVSEGPSGAREPAMTAAQDAAAAAAGAPPLAAAAPLYGQDPQPESSLVAAAEPPPPSSSLFDALRVLPAHVVRWNLLRLIGPRETCALRLLSREWDAQIRNEWCVSLRLVLGADCVRELRARTERGSQHTLAARHTAASRLHLLHRRLDRTIFPAALAAESSGFLEVPPVVVDDAPPLPELLHSLAAPFGPRLRALHLTSDSCAAVSELELDLISVLVPELRELVLRWDACERPAPALGALSCLSALRRLGLQLTNSKLNFDPAPEHMVTSLAPLTGLRSLSLELTASSLPLPGSCLAALTSLRLAVVFRGYSLWQQTKQLCGLVSQLGHLTSLRALAVPAGYWGSDGDLLRSACGVLPSLTALHMPRLSATRPEIEAFARLPLLQEVTLGSLDIAPDEDYEDLLPYDYNDRDNTISDFFSSSSTSYSSLDDPLPRPPPPPLPDTAAAAAAAVEDELSGGLSCRSPPASSPGIKADASRDGGNGRGVGSGVLRSRVSWRQLVLCGEQRMEALVAAGPLPSGLRELRVQQLCWPRGSRADVLTARGVATLHALCADVARLPGAAVHLSLESLPGAATAVSTAAAPPAAAASGGGGGGFASAGAAAGSRGCGSVREVVMTACAALGGVPGLRTLRWAGLLPLLAHLDQQGVVQALGSLKQVSDLEILAGLYGAHRSTSPLFLLHLARGLEAMPRLRRLGLACMTYENDALAQGLPGLLVALRLPLRVDASFVTRADASALRALLDRPGTAAAATGAPNTAKGTAWGGGGGYRGQGGGGDGGAGCGGGPRREGGATVVAWEEDGGGGAAAAGLGRGVAEEGAGGPMGREGQRGFGGWRRGGGLWWAAEEDGEEGAGEGREEGRLWG
ncbi:hypothetical protein PLESTM_001469900 [Pleodorina starrii]|nr:hypothetical protein PLESTM_001469900 [Pleodorina starrii]